MATAYVVMLDVKYESTSVMAVFSQLHLAEAYAKRKNASIPKGCDDVTYVIEQYEIDKEPE